MGREVALDKAGKAREAFPCHVFSLRQCHGVTALGPEAIWRADGKQTPGTILLLSGKLPSI